MAIGADGSIYLCVTCGGHFGLGEWGTFLCAVSPDGTTRWVSHRDWSYVNICPVVGQDGTIYAVDCVSELVALNPDGSTKWVRDLYSEVGIINCPSQLVLGSKGGIFVCGDSCIYCLDPEGSLRWQADLPTSPGYDACIEAIVDGTLYAATGEGGLFAVVCDEDLADAPWPMRCHDPQRTARASNGVK